MLNLKKGLSERCVQEEIRTLAFGDSIVTVISKEFETLEIIGCNSSALTIQGMTRVISRLLRGAFMDCNRVLIGNVEIYKDFSIEEIFNILLTSRFDIAKDTGWNIT